MDIVLSSDEEFEYQYNDNDNKSNRHPKRKDVFDV